VAGGAPDRHVPREGPARGFALALGILTTPEPLCGEALLPSADRLLASRRLEPSGGELVSQSAPRPSLPTTPAGQLPSAPHPVWLYQLSEVIGKPLGRNFGLPRKLGIEWPDGNYKARGKRGHAPRATLDCARRAQCWESCFGRRACCRSGRAAWHSCMDEHTLSQAQTFRPQVSTAWRLSICPPPALNRDGALTFVVCRVATVPTGAAGPMPRPMQDRFEEITLMQAQQFRGYYFPLEAQLQQPVGPRAVNEGARCQAMGCPPLPALGSSRRARRVAAPASVKLPHKNPTPQIIHLLPGPHAAGIHRHDGRAALLPRRPDALHVSWERCPCHPSQGAAALAETALSPKAFSVSQAPRA
jgi:hypothetical protein